MIRAATEDDVDAIADLEVEALGIDAWSRSLVAEGVAGRLPSISYLVAEHEGEVVGYAVASIVADLAELQRIAVAPAHRRGGLATALLDEVVGRALRARADRVLLEVRETNAGALHFYAAQKFVEIDRRARYYRDGSAAIVLVRALVGGGSGR
ncbi:MAG: ribosomal protein S18-alanine N-acetyltransferase [Actinomycetota bacterium]|nr:ribosomal protein S18-alanine N-acetyltransferase [Actinomycetota bacterium]